MYLLVISFLSKLGEPNIEIKVCRLNCDRVKPHEDN